MNRPSFLHGVGLALLASLCGGVLFSVLQEFFAPRDVLRLVIAMLGLVYVLYLLSRSSSRIGRVTTVMLWGLMLGVNWFAAPSLGVYLLAHVGALWLVRSLYYYSSMISALLDLGLCGLSIATALWASAHTGNIFLAIWCFFIGQSLWVAVPVSMSRQVGSGACNPVDDEIFQRAYRTAEAALRRLSVNK